MGNRYKILTEDEKKGDWLDRADLMELMKICYHRNLKMYKLLKSMYEYLEDEKFDESRLNRNKKPLMRRIQQ